MKRALRAPNSAGQLAGAEGGAGGAAADSRKGSMTYAPSVKARLAAELRGVSVRVGTNAAARLARALGLPPPSKSTLHNWFRTLHAAELAAAQSAAAQARPAPTEDELQAAAVAALTDKRGDTGKFVPADVTDAVLEQVEDLLESKISFQRSDVRDMFLGSMQDLHAELLKTNGGWFTCGEDFLRDFERQRKLSRRRITTGGDDGKLGELYTPEIMRMTLQARLASIVYAAEEEGVVIPQRLVVGADETGVHLVPSGRYVLAPTGSRRVARNDSDEKRQITAMVSHDFAGNMLPLQLIFKGTTSQVTPKWPDSKEHKDILEKYRPLFSHSHNHWSNDSTIKLWVRCVLVPYLQGVKRDMKLPTNHPAVLMWDVHWSHRDPSVLNMIRTDFPWLRLLFIPARTTSFLQVCDVAINRPLKVKVEDFTRKWRIAHRKKGGAPERSIPLLRRIVTMALLKGAQEVPADIILNGARHTTLLQVWSKSGKETALANAADCEAAGVLWNTTSKNDKVVRGGELEGGGSVPGMDCDGGGSEDGVAQPVAAAQPPAAGAASGAGAAAPVGGLKRARRVYRCGHCRQHGHMARVCPAALAGQPPHPSARKKARRPNA